MKGQFSTFSGVVSVCIRLQRLVLAVYLTSLTYESHFGALCCSACPSHRPSLFQHFFIFIVLPPPVSEQRTGQMLAAPVRRDALPDAAASMQKEAANTTRSIIARGSSS